MNVSAREYFLSKRPDSGPKRSLYNRIVNAIRMREAEHGIITMEKLCEMPEKELKKIRNLGSTSRAIIAYECGNYLNDKNKDYT